MEKSTYSILRKREKMQFLKPIKARLQKQKNRTKSNAFYSLVKP